MKIIMNQSYEYSIMHGAVECISTVASFVNGFICVLVVSWLLDEAEDKNWLMLETYSPKI